VLKLIDAAELGAALFILGATGGQCPHHARKRKTKLTAAAMQPSLQPNQQPSRRRGPGNLCADAWDQSPSGVKAALIGVDYRACRLWIGEDALEAGETFFRHDSKNSNELCSSHDAREAAAKELRLPVEDWRTRRYSLLTLAIEELEARFATGESLDTDGLARIDAQMQEIRSSLPPEGIKVDVVFVSGVRGIFHCEHCGKRNNVDNMTEETLTEKRARAKADAELVKPVEALKTLPAPNSAPQGTPSPPKAAPQRPYHETAVNSRPNAPADGHSGSLVWVGGVPSSYPLERTK